MIARPERLTAPSIDCSFINSDRGKDERGFLTGP
jgi:hypothetical protein